MKQILCLSLLGVTLATAQNEPRPPVTPVPPPIAPPAAPLDPEPVPAPPRAPARRNRAADAVGNVTENFAEIVAQATSAARNATALALEHAGQLESFGRSFGSFPRSTKTGRTLVVRSSSPDPESLENAEEDLSVMALILRKATGESRGDDKRVAMGIEVFGSSSGARNIHVEGYGALFLLGVRFPLVAPPEKPEEPKKETTSTEWSEARDELLSTARPSFDVDYDVIWRGSSRAAPEEFSSEKVEGLKTALLEALKNATHIRALRPEESVTVVIQGAESPRLEKIVENRGSSRKTAVKKVATERDETVMTVRVKKSDVDAFAMGHLDLADFRKKAALQTYFRRGDASVATSPFLAPPAK